MKKVNTAVFSMVDPSIKPLQQVQQENHNLYDDWDEIKVQLLKALECKVCCVNLFHCLKRRQKLQIVKDSKGAPLLPPLLP